jgi:membrane dipeptidase
MHKKSFFIFVFILSAGIAGSVFLFSTNGFNKSDNMNQINQQSEIKDTSKPVDFFEEYYNSLVLDSHNDFPYQVFKRGADFCEGGDWLQSGLPKFIKGGVDIQVFALWIPKEHFGRSKEYVLDRIDEMEKFQKKCPDEYEIAYNYNDVMRITGERKFCSLFGIEGGTAVEKDLDNINLFFDKGVRYIGLTWNNSNKIGTSSSDESKGKKGGLTDFGKKVIKRMNEVGMIVDVSHLGENSFWDVIEISEDPIIASHSNCYSLNPHHRNLTDAQIKAIAKNGGVVMINFYDEFLSNSKKTGKTNAKTKYGNKIDNLNKLAGGDLIEFNREREKFLNEVTPSDVVTIETIIEHIDYIKNLVGIDYVGIGSDFDGGIDAPFDLYDATCYPLLAQKLYEHGYTQEELKKILGLNFLRVFKQVCG